MESEPAELVCESVLLERSDWRGQLADREGVPVSATDNYTPTTEEVRWGWWSLLLEGAASSAALEDAGWEEERSLAQFDRWLAAERTKAWDEGYEAAARFHESPKGHWQNNHPRAGIRTWIADPAPKNPYREVQ